MCLLTLSDNRIRFRLCDKPVNFGFFTYQNFIEYNIIFTYYFL